MSLTLNMVMVSEKKLRQIIQEELERHENRGLDDLMAAISEPLDETEEMAAVLATLTAEEWQALVQRVKERKLKEDIPDDIA